MTPEACTAIVIVALIIGALIGVAIGVTITNLNNVVKDRHYGSREIDWEDGK